MNHQDNYITSNSVSELLGKFADILGQKNLMGPEDGLDRYLSEWSGDHQGQALAVLKPGTVEDVCAVMALCNKAGMPVVPQGGHTGLVSGAIPNSCDCLIISLERLNTIRQIDPENFSVTVDAGCVLQAVKDAVEDHDCLLPIALGAQGSCQIGGNIATNAGGVNVLCHGMTRDLVLGLEIVLPDGALWDGLSNLRKDNRGYDLKQLFIGSEGTLGIITGACVKLVPQPELVETAYLGVSSFEDAMKVFSHARRVCSDTLTGFEVIGSECIAFARLVHPDLRIPIDERVPVHVLLEVAASRYMNLREMLEEFLAQEMEVNLVSEAVLSQSKAQTATFWQIREGLVEGHAKHGFHVRSDTSVALPNIPHLITALRAMATERYPDWTSQAYGHAGDGNVHFNLLPPPDLSDQENLTIGAQIEDAIFDVVESFKGSFSAEHGIGRTKCARFQSCMDQSHLKLAKAIKEILDPTGIMNPGCIFSRSKRPA